ncbi:MAG TPA: type IX secretion system membrane protein PorP/SprF, partial [Bacteroidales bacterium]|nr:type IX secretion system membrane protein PorP/SprF [Bacteroidales bacterium]
MKYIVSIAIIMCLSIILYAQQKPIPTQYMNDKYFVNSAYAGTTNNATASINAKQYLNGIEGAPTT